mmetsp:Transcript_34944/g.100534  ORF Transcript_34944/g.100534 Transcript_34944/m.100534 type:complete len:171 (+) Transcript_34944:1385-1897(+)
MCGWGYKCVRGDLLPPGKDGSFLDYPQRRQQWERNRVWPPLPENLLSGAADLFSDPDVRSIRIKSVWLRGGGGGRKRKAFVRRQEDGLAWIVPSRDDLDALLGVALNTTCSFVRSSACSGCFAGQRLTPETIDKMRVKELRECCRAVGLLVGGRKAELQARLLDYVKSLP